MHHKQPWGHYNPLESLMIGPVGGIAMCHTNCGNCTRLSLCSDLWQIRFHPVTQLRVRASQFFGQKFANQPFITKWKFSHALKVEDYDKRIEVLTKTLFRPRNIFLLIWKPWKVCTILFLVLFDFLREYLLVFDSPFYIGV